LNYVAFSPDVVGGIAIGGKARALKSLAEAGLPIPPWFVVRTEAFWASLPDTARQRLARATTDEDIGAIVAQATPSTEVQASIMDAVEKLCGDRSLVAVRSSASDEDGVEHSFAGQLETFLFVSPEEVADRVACVWRSGFSPRILAYRRQHGLALIPAAPAVLVQRMVDARVAGVAFSADPVSGRRGIAVVSAAPGLGTGVVSGECDADTWQVDRYGAIVARNIVSKRTAHRQDAGSREGVRSEPIAADVAMRPALDDQAVMAVAALARRAERHFGRPQDIEWAHDDNALHLLQSRPITSLVSQPDPDGQLTLWDNSNIVESYSGVTTPLTFSFASEIYEHVYRQFCRMMRVPAAAIARHDQTFRNMLGLIRGRVYYNLLNWYRVLALLPGFTVNRRFMEQMMGVGEGLPDALAEELATRRTLDRLVDAAHMANSLVGLVVHHFLIDRRVRAFYARLDEALAPPTPPLADRRPDELVAHYRDLRDRLLLHWDAPLVNDFFAMIFYGVLRRLAQAWCGDKEGTLQNDLISGQGGLVSAEPAVRLQRLAALARSDATLVALLVNGPVAQIEAALARQPAFASEYHSYLDRFGERSVNELKLETATLHDDPLPLLRGIGRLAQQEASSTAVSGNSLRDAAHRRVGEALSRRPIRRLTFNWVLRHARARVRDRENLRLERTRLFGRVRRTFLEIGRRFSAVNILSVPRDIFYLEVDEVLAFVEGRSTATSLAALVAIRRREFLEYERLPPPADRFETRGMVYHGHAFHGAALPAMPEGDERRGIGCCPGIVRGPVRVVRDPRDVDLGGRAILVAEHTDPGWIMIFPSAMGVLVERGSLLSHAAIVARELGIPGIVSIPGVTRWLKDGDWVQFDGGTGVVRRIDAAKGGEGTVAQ
jgi:pyruvate,water dikinase